MRPISAGSDRSASPHHLHPGHWSPEEANHVNNLGWTALLEAVILGDGSLPYQQIVQILLDAGARRDLADRDGVTALQHARRSGQAKIAPLLERR
jgi:uncharacterized protein